MVAPTHSQVLAVLRTFLLTVVPTGTEVILFQNNRVPEPDGDFVIMSPLRMTRLSTNLDEFGETSTDITEALRVDIQLDFHAASPVTAADTAVTTSTLLRSWSSTEVFEASGYDVSPLYADDARQSPFVNAEQQYETRWVVDASFQVNAKTTRTNT